MFSPLRNRFGVPGVISVIALVFAMLGGAYAASNNNGGGKATASAKAKRGPRGPKGATGPAGPQGPAGTAGAKGGDGAKGATGATGATGSTGATGNDGKSVTVTSVPTGLSECNEFGGAIVEEEGSGVETEVCNGEKGATGATGTTGAPWPVGGTLPPGAELKGVWAFNATPGETEGGGDALVPISWGIPLKEGFFAGEGKVHISGEPTFSTSCELSPETSKVKVNGNLCIWKSLTPIVGATLLGVTEPFGEELGTAGAMGAVIHFGVTDSKAHAEGTWAVRGF